jgi:hypothetical protein
MKSLTSRKLLLTLCLVLAAATCSLAAQQTEDGESSTTTQNSMLKHIKEAVSKVFSVDLTTVDKVKDTTMDITENVIDGSVKAQKQVDDAPAEQVVISAQETIMKGSYHHETVTDEITDKARAESEHAQDVTSKATETMFGY